MDVQTATIDPASAKEQLAQYRTIKQPTEEERAIIAGLIAAVAGKPLVNLREAIVSGGSFDDGCPHFGVSAPTHAWCYVTRNREGEVVYRADPSTNAHNKTVRVPGFPPLDHSVLEAARLNTFGWQRDRRRTQVPIIPPQHRVRGWKTKCMVLWEVEEWAVHQVPRPPGDPMLLRHLIDDFYSVEATWDLTELEMLVLGARR